MQLIPSFVELHHLDLPYDSTMIPYRIGLGRYQVDSRDDVIGLTISPLSPTASLWLMRFTTTVMKNCLSMKDNYIGYHWNWL